jgi:A/G-specific adenine glycosylase
LITFFPFTFRWLRVFRVSPFLNSKSKNSKLVAPLLEWFATNARDLPWRRTRDPYAIWVSEIMLQQTQVKTVIPYWERWMRELPDVESLAKASADKIHKLWEGLGYYTRVRNMQKAAQQIMASKSAEAADISPLYLKSEQNRSRPTSAATTRKRNVAGDFPTTFDAVIALPGIGRYTAGAICSIAYNQPTPILDGNVIRVLTRIHGIKTNPCEKHTNVQLWQLAAELVTQAKGAESAKESKQIPLGTSRPLLEKNSCSHFNQSLMELGALICTPRSPNCAACPAQKLCIARKENLQEQLPNLGKRAATTDRRFIAFVVERNAKFLVRQRPDGVVNAHLWEFPNVETVAQGTDAPYKQNAYFISSAKPLCTIKHSITRYRITLEAWRAELSSPHKKQPADRWCTLGQLRELAFTSAHRKILSRIADEKFV